MAKIRPIAVLHKDEEVKFYCCANDAAQEWGCSNQTVLDMIRKCKERPNEPLKRCPTAVKNNVWYIVEIENFNEFIQSFIKLTHNSDL